ncbi:MAG TPA: ROK family protein [Kiritimatiellia bacterium]|nr:ROK family protein [Kiritimatiellia bacterium]
MTHRIGIDLGGTKIEGAVLDPHGHILVRRRIPTLPEQGYPSILERIASLYRDILHEAGSPEHTFGIGTPGALSPHTGLLKNSNTLCLNGNPLHHDLERLIQRPLRIENDANCFALAEALHGAARGHRMVFGVIMGTGCGGGLIIDGHIWTGPQAIGGEWGHMSIDPLGPSCYCGRRGCVETYISGSGLQRQWHEQHADHRALTDIVAAYRAQDPLAIPFMNHFFETFGRALGNLINALDPDVIVLGGGVSNIDELYTLGADAVRRNLFSDHPHITLLRHQLGDSAGVIGAALNGI